jgi:hypothetical protein
MTDKRLPVTVRRAWEEPPLGDRRQEIVLIGLGLNEADILAKLENCLNSDSLLNR